MFPSHLQYYDSVALAVSTHPHRCPKLHTTYFTAQLDLLNLLLNIVSTVTTDRLVLHTIQGYSAVPQQGLVSQLLL